MPSLLILYHYFHPDDVVSARLYSDLGRELAGRGWTVRAMPCNRGRENEAERHPLRETWEGVDIQRVWRPRFPQSRGWGRFLNAVWMLLAWSLRAWLGKKENAPDVVLIGTDPVLSLLAGLSWKKRRPGTHIVHWCFDLYPEAAVAGGLLRENSRAVAWCRALMRRSYRSCSLIADLGPCMRDKLDDQAAVSRRMTLTPWSVMEPESFSPTPGNGSTGSASDLLLLYSGNFGRAHSYHLFYRLAERLQGDPVRLRFSVRGSRVQELKAALPEGCANVEFLDYAAEGELEARLRSADVHLVSLNPAWEGCVVPSKFFSSLAAGRPVLFAGPPQSAIACWIREHRVGWVLEESNLEALARELRALAADRRRLAVLQSHCDSVYRQHFSRKQVLDFWQVELSTLTGTRMCASLQLENLTMSSPGVSLE